MLGSIEELEKDIEQFQQNMAASGEMQMLLKQMLEQIKQQNVEFGNQSTALISRVDNIPSTIENANISSNNRVKNDVVAEIDRAIQSFASEQGKYISILQQTQNEIKSCEDELTEKYTEFNNQLQKTNISDIYDQNIQLRNELNKRTTILMVISAISIVVGIIGIVI